MRLAEAVYEVRPLFTSNVQVITQAANLRGWLYSSGIATANRMKVEYP